MILIFFFCKEKKKVSFRFFFPVFEGGGRKNLSKKSFFAPLPAPARRKIRNSFFDPLPLPARTGRKKTSLLFLPVPDLELRDHVSDLHQHHRPSHQRRPRSQSPLGAPVLDVRPDITQLARRLRDSENQSEAPLVELEAGLALGPLLSLEFFQGREGGGEELEDDGGVDVGDDAGVFFFLETAGKERGRRSAVKFSFRKKKKPRKKKKNLSKTHPKENSPTRLIDPPESVSMYPSNPPDLRLAPKASTSTPGSLS